jgi:hypothetical protein
MVLRTSYVVLGLLALTGVVAATAGGTANPPRARASATCDDYPDQAAAQRAADTRDGDGDGVYCQSLPCPCLSPTGATEESAPVAPRRVGCIKPSGVRNIAFSRRTYPNIRRHFRAALRRGWPRTLVVNRQGAAARRDRLLGGISTRAGYDRDEYPPAMARGRGKGLAGGTHPRGWRGDVRYVASSENRSHGSVLGSRLRRFCDGTRFRYVFR